MVIFTLIRSIICTAPVEQSSNASFGSTDRNSLKIQNKIKSRFKEDYYTPVEPDQKP